MATSPSPPNSPIPQQAIPSRSFLQRGRHDSRKAGKHQWARAESPVAYPKPDIRKNGFRLRLARTSELVG